LNFENKSGVEGITGFCQWYQSIFAVEPSVWARWEGILIENLKKKIKKKENNNNIFFLLGVTENGITQKPFFYIFKIW
jgi:hypothetical protein